MRGQITEEIKRKAKGLLGINTRELRLLPYIQYVLMNDKLIDSRKVNKEEHLVINRWIELGFIGSDLSKLTVSKKFWHGMNEILWLAYVNHE